MIFFDVTKTMGGSHRSGLMRVSTRLGRGFARSATWVRWGLWDRAATRQDWYFTAELFSEEERPGLTAFLDSHVCHTAALFHDAIPLKHPHITWPQSVARHPGYMKLLSHFDRVWAVSEASGHDLIDFWKWQGVEQPPIVDLLPLGSDLLGVHRVTEPVTKAAPPPSLVCIGIVEPRKNQGFLLAVCTELWDEGLVFDLHVLGRVNPHFGAGVAAQMKALGPRFPGLHYHAAAEDAELVALLRTARATVFPTIAEGCGLPLLESLWMGVPCVCSDLPVLLENAQDGGCLAVRVNDLAAWKTALRQILTDDALHARLSGEAMTRRLSTWQSAAVTLVHSFRV